MPEIYIFSFNGVEIYFRGTAPHLAPEIVNYDKTFLNERILLLTKKSVKIEFFNLIFDYFIKFLYIIVTVYKRGIRHERKN